MPIHHYVVLTSAKPGQLEEFERWYDNQHLHDLMALPEIKSAKRYRLNAAVTDTVGAAPWNSLAIYEIEADDPLPVVRKISALAGSAAMPMTDAISDSRLRIIGELVNTLPG
jgi:hypothetical protein